MKKLLPEMDVEYLLEKQYDFEVIQAGGNLNLIIHHFPFPSPYQPNEADVLIMMPAGYPNGKLDMFWTYPDVKKNGGQWPASSEHHEDHHGKKWQRWSRHLTSEWRVGVDNLRTFMAAVIKEIGKGI